MCAAWAAFLAAPLCHAADGAGAGTLPAVREEEAAAEWADLIGRVRALPAEQKVTRVNEIINRRIAYERDVAGGGAREHWAAPLQTLARGSGDCKDFAIAKYFALREAGIPDAQLRLMLVGLRDGGPYGTLTERHLVLAWLPRSARELLVLDNLMESIRPLSLRPDLVPLMSFNARSVWSGAGGPGALRTSADRLTRWRRLLVANGMANRLRE